MMKKGTKAGFIDLQVNGYEGVDFSSNNLTVKKITNVVESLKRKGTVGFCPTIVSSEKRIYEKNLPIFAEAMKNPMVSRHIIGIHLEGPFISSKKEAIGCHSKKFIRKPDLDLFERWQKLSENNIIMITVAPEVDGAIKFIKDISQKNIIVSLGHHLADNTTINKAIIAGAKASTHLGNGISKMVNRHANPIIDQLAQDNLFGLFIADGHHIPGNFIKISLKSKTSNKFIITSDAAPFAGLGAGSFEWKGEKIFVSKQGRARLRYTDLLAGSTVSMLECIKYLRSLDLLSENDIWKAVWYNPIKLLKLKQKKINDMDVLSYQSKKELFNF